MNRLAIPNTDRLRKARDRIGAAAHEVIVGAGLDVPWKARDELLFAITEEIAATIEAVLTSPPYALKEWHRDQHSPGRENMDRGIIKPDRGESK